MLVVGKIHLLRKLGGSHRSYFSLAVTCATYSSAPRAVVLPEALNSYLGRTRKDFHSLYSIQKGNKANQSKGLTLNPQTKWNDGNITIPRLSVLERSRRMLLKLKKKSKRNQLAYRRIDSTIRSFFFTDDAMRSDPISNHCG